MTRLQKAERAVLRAAIHLRNGAWHAPDIHAREMKLYRAVDRLLDLPVRTSKAKAGKRKGKK